MKPRVVHLLSTSPTVLTMMKPLSQSMRLQVVDISRSSSQRFQITARDLKSGQSSNKPEDEDIQVLKYVETEYLKQVVIEGVWTQNKIIKNTVMHLLNPLFDSSTSTYIVNNSSGFLVVEPDSLLTCTQVASSLFCERKTWLNHVFLGEVGTNRAMLVGTLVHEVFQHGVKKRIADIDKLTKFLDELIDNATIMLEAYSVEVHISEIRKEALSYISSVKEWIEKYMFSGPKYPLTNDSNLEVKIIDVHDIEENVWSPKYGLKGKIDVTGSVRTYDKQTNSSSDKIIPLELKTGNPNLSSSHAAQVSLYSMMIEDRYAETNQGFVIYLKDKAAMHNVVLTHNIKRDLIQRRNQINFYMKSHFVGPDMIDQTRICSNCERVTECILMSDLYTPGRIEGFKSMKALEPGAIGHLSSSFRKFFKDYHEKLVTVLTGGETKGLDGDSKAPGSFWTYSSDVAESRKTGFGKLKVESFQDQKDTPFITFKRHPKYIKLGQNGTAGKTSPGVAMKKRKIEDYFKPMKKTHEKPKGRLFDTSLEYSRCRFAISFDDDNDNMDSQNSSTAIAIGFINEIKEDLFTMKIYEGGADLLKSDQVYRVDKIEKRAQIDINRLVLVRLIAREDWRCERIRQLILDPEFKPIENVELNLFVLSTAFEEVSELDARKQKCVVEAVSTDNYYILDETIEPNKDKIHKIISVFVNVVKVLDRTALIVANNIDHLCQLMKFLQDSGIRFILIDDGKSTKARHQFASNIVRVPQVPGVDLSKKFDCYIRLHELASIVITSYAMSVGGLQFTRRKFDYCVAYDCDNTDLLVSLSPMFCSDRFIIIDVNEGKKTTNTHHSYNDISLGKHLRNLRSRNNNKTDGIACLTIDD